MTAVPIFTAGWGGDNVEHPVLINFRCERQRRLFLPRTTSHILLPAAQVFAALFKVVSPKMNQSHDRLVGNTLDLLSPPDLPSLPADALSPSHAHTPRALIISDGLLIFVTYSGRCSPACSPALIENLQMKLGSGCSDPTLQSTGSEQRRTLEAACLFCCCFSIEPQKIRLSHHVHEALFCRLKGKRQD